MRLLLGIFKKYLALASPSNWGECVSVIFKYLVLPAAWTAAIYFYVVSFNKPEDVLVEILIKKYWEIWQNLIAVMTIFSSFLLATTTVLVWITEVDNAKLEEYVDWYYSKEYLIKKMATLREMLFYESVLCLMFVAVACVLVIASSIFKCLFLHFATVFILLQATVMLLSLTGAFAHYWSICSLKSLKIVN